MTFNLNNYKVSGMDYTHQSLKGGKFKIPQGELDNFYNYCIENPSACLCEKLPEVFPLYFDIDGLDINVDINNVIDNLKEDLIEKFFDLEEDVNIVVLNNKVKTSNYHIIVTNVMTTKKDAKNIAKELNIELNELEEIKEEIEILDTNAYNSCLRMLGTGKYDRRKNPKLDVDSIYVINEDLNDPEIVNLPIVDQLKISSISNTDRLPMTPFSDFYKGITEEQEELEKKLSNNILDNILPNVDEMKDDFDQQMFENEKTRNDYYYTELTKNKNDYLRKILYKCLKPNRLEDYDEWIKLIYIFKNTKLPILELINYSRQSNKFDKNALDIIKNIMKNNQESDRKIGYRKLLTMAKEDNLKEFQKINFALSRLEYHDLHISYDEIRRQVARQEKGLATLFFNIIKSRVICHVAGKNDRTYFYWNGNIWKKDDTKLLNLLMADILEVLLMNYQNYMNLIVAKETDQENQTFLNVEKVLLKRCFSMINNFDKIENIKKWLCTFLGNNININILDSNPDILSVKNGVIDLKTGELRPRYCEDYLTFYLDTEYDEKENCSDIEQLFNDMMLDDPDMVDFLQRCLGYSITGHTHEQVLFIWTGIGSNGKSFTVKLLSDLLQKNYFAGLSGDALTVKFKKGTATTAYNNLDGKRVAVLDESDKQQTLNEGTIKRFTGESPVTIRKLYQEEMDITLKSKFIISTNYLPSITDDAALHRRLLVFNFEALFLDEHTKIKYDASNPLHRYKKNAADLRESVTLEKLLSWLVKGSIKWYQNGLKNKPKRVLVATENYIVESDPLLDFIKYYCEPCEEGTELSIFKGEYEDNTEQSFKIREFKKELQRKSVQFYVSNRKTFVNYKVVRSKEDSL